MNLDIIDIYSFNQESRDHEIHWKQRNSNEISSALISCWKRAVFGRSVKVEWNFSPVIARVRSITCHSLVLVDIDKVLYLLHTMPIYQLTLTYDICPFLARFWPLSDRFG